MLAASHYFLLFAKAKIRMRCNNHIHDAYDSDATAGLSTCVSVLAVHDDHPVSVSRSAARFLLILMAFRALASRRPRAVQRRRESVPPVAQGGRDARSVY
jgi:hypothetical protein